MIKNNYFKNIFIFLNSIDEIIKLNILKNKNINLIYEDQNLDCQNFLNIKNFCRKFNIKLFILDNYKNAIKSKVNGIVLSHFNKKKMYLGNPLSRIKKFEIIGKSHNQLEYYFKIRQKCSKIIISPIFFTKKYSQSSILNIQKYNLLTKNWLIPKYALGGINFNNLKKVRMTNSEGIAIKSLIKQDRFRKIS